MVEQCFICGYNNPNGLHDHHITPQNVGGSDEPENIIQLCGSCHTALHQLYGAEFFKEIFGGDILSEESVNNYREPTYIAPEESIDRIPDLKAAKHVYIEPFNFQLNLGHVDNWFDFWKWLPEWSDRPWGEHFDYVIEQVEQHVDEAKEYFEEYRQQNKVKEAGWEPVYVIESQNPRERPRIEIREYPDDKVMAPNEDRPYRLHCAYCHAVYTENEFSDLAYHLKVRHGVDPYERTATDAEGEYTYLFERPVESELEIEPNFKHGNHD